MNTMTVETLQTCADGGNRHGIDTLKSFIPKNWVFESRAGSDRCEMR